MPEASKGFPTAPVCLDSSNTLTHAPQDTHNKAHMNNRTQTRLCWLSCLDGSKYYQSFVGPSCPPISKVWVVTFTRFAYFRVVVHLLCGDAKAIRFGSKIGFWILTGWQLGSKGRTHCPENCTPAKNCSTNCRILTKGWIWKPTFEEPGNMQLNLCHFGSIIISWGYSRDPVLSN